MLALAAIGCAPPFDIVLLNSGTRNVSGAHVSFNGFQSLGGVLVPNAEKVHGGVNERVPEMAALEWIDSSGRSHTTSLTVPPRPSGEKGLVFEISDSNDPRVYWR